MRGYVRRVSVSGATIEPIEPRLHLAADPVPRPSYNTGTGFFVVEGKVYDANGYPFVMKGPNNNHAWGSYTNNYNAIDHIARTGANAARAVMYQNIIADPTNNWTDAADTPARRKVVVERYLANGVVPVVEDHASIQDSSSQSNPAALHEITTHWLDNAAWLKQYEKYVILNIANEWGPPAGANGTNTVWRDNYITQVQRLRAGPDGNLASESDNINALIMIDAGQWGQDLNTLQYHADDILAADPQHNVVFSIHLYGQWRADDRNFEVNGAPNSDFGPWNMVTRLAALKHSGIPLVIGEWAWEDFRDFSNLTAPYGAYRTRRVMELADELGIGWLGWSWNHSSPTTLNMIAGAIQNYQYNTNTDLTDWGNWLVNDPDFGTKASAARATVFPVSETLPNPPAPLSPLPGAPPSDVRFVLEKTLVNIAEGGQGAARVRLNKQPAGNVVVNLAKVSGGTNDADLSLVGSTLTFAPENWDESQPILLTAAADADTTTGTAKFQLAASGLLSTDFLAKEIEPPAAPGSVTVNPIADRLYNGSGALGSVSVTSTFPPNGAPNGTLFMRFNLASLTGKIAAATLRLFTTNTTTNRFVRVFHTISDAWTETSSTGINASYPVHPNPRPPGDGFLLPTSGGSYVDISYPELTSLVRAEHFKDGIVSLAIRMVSGTATFHTREGVSPPQLVLATVEAVPPAVVASSFDFATAPHKLSFTFSEDVSATLSEADVLVESVSEPGNVLTLSPPTYNAGTNTATFSIAPVIVPDGTYRARVVAAGVSDAAGNALLTEETLPFFYLAADFNHDGRVNLSDFNTLAANFGTSGGATFAQGDANYDGNVNLADFNILAGRFGAVVSSPAPRIDAFDRFVDPDDQESEFGLPVA